MRTLQYVAVMEAGSNGAFGVWFPDLPGCVSAGDTEAEARAGAAEALSLHIESILEDGEALPTPSSPNSFEAEEGGPAFLYYFLVEAGREALLKRLRAFRGRLPADFKFDRDEANGR
jgi:predicted RNase H-like HicB family nuclease